MDAKALARWRRMAMASTAGLVAEESCRRIEIHDGEGVLAMTDGATRQDHDNANFWAEARSIVLALLDEVSERCCRDCDFCSDARETEKRSRLADERAAALDDKAKEMREER